ncbi:MAG TPA: TonB-dependent receptor [Candidatus Limnocylindria bacterium]|nr:TonB-dependent receptor [Candidatus Limnocylindria bacterium]
MPPVRPAATPRASSSPFAVVLARACLLACVASGRALAQSSVEPPAAPADAEASPVALPEVEVVGRKDSLVGVADSASQGTVGAKEIEARPLYRPAEVLETVPGLIATQHSGAGKANQYFLRGFNLDHGTDFATSVNGMPVNLPTNGHGQGYTDLNFIIPELVRTVRYKKGVYYADEGDFSSAGAADLRYFDALPRGLAQVEAGMYDYYRALVADSSRVGGGTLLYAGELLYNDGPWDHPAHFLKGNLYLSYTMGDERRGATVTGMAYKGGWDSTDQVAKRAVNQGLISRFGTLDPSDGGDSQRYSLSGEWHRATSNGTTRVSAYAFYYDLDLFSNFTYFLDDPRNGDQFEQKDNRWVQGAHARHDWVAALGEIDTDNTLGLQVRNDVIRVGLFKTRQQERLSTTRTDHVVETSVSPYFETREQWSSWLRTVAGVRVDVFNFDVDSNDPANSGTVTDAIASPKLSLIFGPWAETEVYANGGLGFHSNDARGTTTTVDPSTGRRVDPVDPLVRTYGAEIGTRTTRISKLHSTLAFWWLHIDSELLFIGDAGTTEASRPSQRYGVEWANFYSLTRWLDLDADIAATHARFSDDAPEGDHIPGAPNVVVASGLTLHDFHGFFGAFRVRYFGPRPLTEDNRVTSDPTFLTSLQLGYQFDETWSVRADVFNLFDREDSDIDYFYASRLRGEPPGPDDGGYNDIHFHPVEPITARFAVIARF